MAVTLTGTGGLMTRIGKIGKVLYLLDGDEAALPAAVEAVHAQYDSALQDLIGPLESAKDGMVRVPSGAMGPLQSLAVQTVLRQVGADVPAAGRSLPAALAELIRQMKASGDTVKACAVTATAAAVAGNTGTGAVVASTKRGDGLVKEDMTAEVARLLCTADSYTGGRTAGQESFTLTGAANSAGLFDYDYPQGSGSSLALSSVSPAQDASATGNLLTNGDFETWSGSPLQAENWAIATGVWNTDVIQQATPFLGTYAAKWKNTAVLSFIRQQFASTTTTGASAGTNVTPTPLSSYAVNLWLRRVSSAITTGTLRVRLVDGSNAVVNDDAGTANSFTVTLSTLTTSYVAFGGTFRMPSAMPATLKLEISLTVANDQDFLLDDVSLTPLAVPYAGGPGLSVFRGATPWKVGDQFDVTTTNDRGGSSYLATFQALFDRLFNMRSLNLLLPSAGSPTILDTLITT